MADSDFPDSPDLIGIQEASKPVRPRPDVDAHDIQRGFDTIVKRMTEIESVTLAHIELHRLTLSAFLELDLIELDLLTNALHEIADRQSERIPRDMILGLIESFKTSHGETAPSEPTLRLVSSQPRPHDRGNPDSDE